jgi:hypothetical protein
LLDHLADPIFGNRFENFDRIFLPAQEGLRELIRLFGRDLAGHWRFVRIDDRLDHGRSVMIQRLAQNALGILGALDGESASAACIRYHREIDGLKLYAAPI